MRPWHVVLFALFAVACTAGAGGGAMWTGLIGLIASVAFVVACSGGPDNNKDEPDVGPCLSIDPGDMNVNNVNNVDPDVGPCLSIAPTDMNNINNEPDFGPCLSPLPPDFGTPDMGAPDIGTDAGDGADAGDAGDMAAAPTEKSQLLAKMRDRLPEDVVSRLESDDDLA